MWIREYTRDPCVEYISLLNTARSYSFGERDEQTGKARVVQVVVHQTITQEIVSRIHPCERQSYTIVSARRPNGETTLLSQARRFFSWLLFRFTANFSILPHRYRTLRIPFIYSIREKKRDSYNPFASFRFTLTHGCIVISCGIWKYRLTATSDDATSWTADTRQREIRYQDSTYFYCWQLKY